jgi:hypothetical protein
MRARRDDVVEPQKTAKRMADNDALPGPELFELRAEKSHPALELRSVGVRELGIDHDFAIRSKSLRHMVLPMAGWTMVFNAVNDQEPSTTIASHRSSFAATDLLFVRA